MADTATTVRLNVGGVHFEVSRSLIAQHDSSMLARLVSDTWQTDPEAIIFIDRDGETFRHCLDFLRYGRISLPLTIAPKAFLRDMDYYGIAVVDASLVDVGGPFAQAAACIVECRKQIRAEIHDVETRLACLEIADECFARYSLDGRLTFQFPHEDKKKPNGRLIFQIPHEDKKKPNLKERELFNHAGIVNHSQESFVEYLGKYGFDLKSVHFCDLPYNYTICLKIAAPTGANAN